MYRNLVFMAGEISKCEPPYEIAEEKFYQLKIPRKSGTIDVIYVKLADNLSAEIEDKELVILSGKICSQNTSENKENNHLIVYVQAEEIQKVTDEEIEKILNNNFVQLEGYLCKKNHLRKTNSDCILLDTLIAYNYESEGKRKSYYIPTIFWEEIADKIDASYKIGEKIIVEGRFQSRNYYKKNNEGDDKIFTTYEISVQNLGNDDDN